MIPAAKNLFVFFNVFPPKNKKVRQPRSAHRKTQTPIVAKQTLTDRDTNTNHTVKWNLCFYQIQKTVRFKKDIITPQKDNIPISVY